MQMPFFLIKLNQKNGRIHNGKQSRHCLAYDKQFILDSHQKINDKRTKEWIRETLLERISLESVCRVFVVSMPWPLRFIDSLTSELPEDLDAAFTTEDNELVVILLEADELWGALLDLR